MTNSFYSVHPELVCEWSERNAPLTAAQVTYGSKKEYWWIGSCGHEWKASVRSRSSGESCPYCAGRRVLEGFNDLASKRPELVKEWSPKNTTKPTDVIWTSHKKVIWIDQFGHEWEASIRNRSNGSGCPFCSHRTIKVGFNDLESTHPKVALEWSERNYPLKANMVMAFSNKKAWWKCSLGHEWRALISTRSSGSQCPYCSGIELLKGFNDFATKFPAMSKEWSDRNFPLMPDQINEKSRLNVWWKCIKCANEWKAVVSSRVHGSPCPVCADRNVKPGYNDLPTTDPCLMNEWDFEKNQKSPPLVSRYSRYSYWWKCRFGHSYKATVYDKALESKKCSVCEKEYKRVFPQLIISYYAWKSGLEIILNDNELLGITIETLLPEEKIAIESSTDPYEINDVKKHLCSANGIELVTIEYKNDISETEYANKIIEFLRKKNIYIKTDTDDDVRKIRSKFWDWKEKKI